MELGFNRNDGGQSTAGHDPDNGDCVIRAIAVALQLPYQEVLDGILAEHRDWIWTSGDQSAAFCDAMAGTDQEIHPQRHGTHWDVGKRYLRKRGWSWVEKETPMQPVAIPANRVIMAFPSHACAVIENVINDTFDPRERGMTVAFGYFIETGDTTPSYIEMVEIFGQDEVDEMVADGELEVPEDLI